MELIFDGEIFCWRGPAPYFFVRVPEAEAAQIQLAASAVSYGWGMIPATVRLGGTIWTTSLWPKDGSYVVPLKDAVRRAERVGDGDRVTLDVRLAW